MRSYIKFIEDTASKTIMLYSDYRLPINPINIANNMGVKVYAKRNAAQLLDVIEAPGNVTNSMAFALKYDGDIVIIVDDVFLSPNERRLAVAHEIGHVIQNFFIENATKTDEAINSIYGTHPVEITCDIFAFNLLMPKYVLTALDITSPECISRICKVDALQAFVMHQQTQHYKPMSDMDIRMYLRFLPFIREVKAKRQTAKPAARPTLNIDLISDLSSDLSAELAY